MINERRLNPNDYKEKIDVDALTVIWSAQCTLRCHYCFIDKCKNHNTYNKKLREQIQNGSMAKNAINNYPKTLKSMDFWGAEPTINGDLMDMWLNQVCPHFTEVNEFMFSTNCTSGYKLNDQMTDSLCKWARYYRDTHNRERFTIHIQLSMDGPEYMTDFNRGRGVTKKVIDYYQHLIERLNTEDLENIHVCINFKPTLSPDNMIEQITFPSKMVEWFEFFHKVVVDGEALIKNPNIITGEPYPTIVVPGEHSKEDGVYFAKWLEQLDNLDLNHLEKYKNQPLYNVGMRNMLYAHMMDYLVDQPWAVSCGGGNGSMVQNLDNELHLCHRNFTSAILTFEGLNRADDDRLMHCTSVKDVNDRYKTLKLDYMSKAFHCNPNMRFLAMKAVAIQAARAGEIDEFFLNCDDAYYALLYLATSGPQCHLGSFEIAGDFSIPTMSQLRFWGNGAWRQIIKMTERWLNNSGAF